MYVQELTHDFFFTDNFLQRVQFNLLTKSESDYLTL